MTADRRSSDKKLRTLYLVLCAALVVLGWPVTVALDQEHTNCVASRVNAHQLNAYIASQISNTINSKLLTDADKAERVKQYSKIVFFEPKSCPGVWPWEN